MFSPIIYEIMVDWDMANWAAIPDFTQGIDNISSDVFAWATSRGKDKEAGNMVAATLELQVRNYTGKYSPTNGGSPLYGKMLPWRIIRLRAYHNSIWYVLFTGFISKYQVKPHPEVQIANLYATDGMDLLARQTLTQDQENIIPMSDGAAVNTILNTAGWSSIKRDVDVDGGVDLLGYPAATEYEVS